jgi:hypothetical protein
MTVKKSIIITTTKTNLSISEQVAKVKEIMGEDFNKKKKFFRRKKKDDLEQSLPENLRYLAKLM